MQKKKYSLTVLSIILILGTGLLFVFKGVHADDEEDDSDEYEYEDAAPESVATPTVTTKDETTTEKQTIVVTPERVVTENKVVTISLPDRDRDGIADQDDPHPDIPEVYIVSDDNQNGIVDTLEYAAE